MKGVTIYTIAKELNMTPSMVSRALNPSGRVDEAKRRLVLETAEKYKGWTRILRFFKQKGAPCGAPLEKRGRRRGSDPGNIARIKRGQGRPQGLRIRDPLVARCRKQPLFQRTVELTADRHIVL